MPDPPDVARLQAENDELRSRTAQLQQTIDALESERELLIARGRSAHDLLAIPQFTAGACSSGSAPEGLPSAPESGSDR